MPRAKKTESVAEPVKVEPVKYEAVEDFRDLQDGGKVYFAGDRYPNPVNKKISDERIK
jgi:hypothetical protein